MEKFLIKGPTPKGVLGSINCSGAKNAALPLMAASILFEGTVVLKNLPLVNDVKTMMVLLQALGSKVELFQQLSRDYYCLANDVGQELVKSPETRAGVTNFMKNTDTRYRDLEKSTPPIPRPVVTFFISQEQLNHGWDKMYKPDILSTLTPTRYLIYTRQLDENIGAILDRTRPIQGSVVGEGGTITDIL